MKELLMKVALEAHTMGRIYRGGGEIEPPAQFVSDLKDMIDAKIEEAKDVKIGDRNCTHCYHDRLCKISFEMKAMAFVLTTNLAKGVAGKPPHSYLTDLIGEHCKNFEEVEIDGL